PRAQRDADPRVVEAGGAGGGTFTPLPGDPADAAADDRRPVGGAAEGELHDDAVALDGGIDRRGDHVVDVDLPLAGLVRPRHVVHPLGYAQVPLLAARQLDVALVVVPRHAAPAAGFRTVVAQPDLHIADGVVECSGQVVLGQLDGRIPDLAVQCVRGGRQ